MILSIIDAAEARKKVTSSLKHLENQAAQRIKEALNKAIQDATTYFVIPISYFFGIQKPAEHEHIIKELISKGYKVTPRSETDGYDNTRELVQYDVEF
jgi:hypothetical protein